MSDEFLSRWSRRKRDAAAEAEREVPPDAPAEAAEDAPEESDADVLARLGLKHPDEMEPGDDFAAFLRAAVPRHLKSLAYRRLWRSNPTLACLDGLNDYDGDFTGTGVPEGGLKTAYEVGRGIARRFTDPGEEAADAPADDAAGGADDDVALAVEVTGDSTADDSAEKAAEGAQAPESVQRNDTPRATRRRMVFRATAQSRGS